LPILRVFTGKHDICVRSAENLLELAHIKPIRGVDQRPRSLLRVVERSSRGCRSRAASVDRARWSPRRNLLAKRCNRHAQAQAE
jgi:hypothetical protein